MKHPNRTWKIAAIAVFPVVVALSAAVYLDDPYQYLNYVREDGLFEWLTVACMAIAGLISLDIGIRLLRLEGRFEWFFFVFGLFCLFVTFEEISWGQRLFNLASPEYFLSNSDQQEINIHNVLQQKLDFKTKDLAALVLSLYGIALPLLALNRHVAALLQRFRLIVPPLYLIPGFLIASVLMLDIPTGFEEEIGEFLFGLCFLLFMMHELLARGMGVVAEPDSHLETRQRSLRLTVDRLAILGLTLAAFGLHLWQLESKSLRLKEAMHTAAAYAPPVEIIRHGWTFGTIEQSGWLLSLGVWQPLAGSSEFALRFLPALAATIAVPILWQTCRVMLPGWITFRLFAGLLLTLAPALHFYAQDASIYALSVSQATLSLYLTVSLCRKPGYLRLVLWLSVAWLLMVSHWFAATIVMVEATALAVVLFNRSLSQINRAWAGAILILALLPVLVWALASPGVQPALASSTTLLDPDDWSHSMRTAQLWKALTFGQAQLQSYRSRLSIVILPLFLCGIVVLLLWRRIFKRSGLAISPTVLSWLLSASVILPILVALFALPALPTAALLISLPMLLIVCALGAIYLLRSVPLVGAVAMLLAVALAVTGLVTYNTGYTKSGYLAMAEFMNANLHADDGVVLAAPSQRFLADYYLDTENVETVPQTTLSSYWPQETATLVPHEVDGQIQSYLHEYPAIWLARYDEDSVDPGRFLPSYLTAVAYHDDCLEWKDVELCRFISPRGVQPRDLEIGEHLYGGELALGNAKLTTDSQSIQGTPMLLVELDWKATAPISADYKISLRLMDGAGEPIAQRDDFPIGPLLPPSVWGSGDQKTGYMALPLPETVAAGQYELQLVLYNPADMQLIQYQTSMGKQSSDPLTLAVIEIDEDGMSSPRP